MKRKKKARKITKAVIALAGYATRFLPATKNQPKQMLPIVDKPIIQYVVEEAVRAGIKDIVLVTQAGQTALEDYFDSSKELENFLEKTGKENALNQIRKIPEMANFIYVRQNKNLPYGNAIPLLTASPLIDDDEDFVYMFGDDIVKAKRPAIGQLIDVFEKYRPAAILGVQERPWEEIERYGTVRYKKGTRINQIVEMLEKMPRDKAPSNMAQFGRFVFSHKVIRQAKKTPLGKNNELWVTDILNELAHKDRVIAQPIEGEWLDTGDPLNYLRATIRCGLQRKDIKKELAKILKEEMVKYEKEQL